MRDILNSLLADPGSLTFGEMVRERVSAAHEIRKLRAEIERLHVPSTKPHASSNERPVAPSGIEDFNNNPIRFVRAKELKQIIGYGHSSIWRLTKEGRFPQPVRFGRSTFWRLADVLAWQESLSS